MTDSAPARLDTTPDGVATITLTNPVKRNAFDADTIIALTGLFRAVKEADGVRVLFLTGQGEAFSAGANLEWMLAASQKSEADNREDAMTFATMMRTLADIPCLTVALVNGAAMGGGAGLVAACDVAIAAKGAKFSFSEARLGLLPATIGPYAVQAIGPRWAKALFMTARVFDADFAREIGLVHEVVEDAADLDAAKARLTAEIMACAPGAVAETKALVEDIVGREIDNGLMQETARRLARRRVSDEGREGVTAFFERRKPSWAQ